SLRAARQMDQRLSPSKHRGGLKDVDHPPVVVTPGLPRSGRGVPAEDLIQSARHPLMLLVTEMHVPQRNDPSVARNCSMLSAHAKVVDPSVAVRLSASQ